ncbi:MAG: hypothetical protein HWN68_18825, partial [Desulfobacterales bacterium]|nr:hypothetical protein [Desulfobacterales bacterium]
MPPEEAKQFVEDQQNLELAEEGIWLGIILYAGIQGARALPYVGRAVKEGFSRVLWREDPMPIVRQIQKLGLSYERMVEINRGAKATEEELAKYKQLGKLTERKLRKPFEWVMKRFRAEPTEVFVRGKPPEPSVRRALPGPPGVAARPAPEVREPVPRVYEEKPMAVVTPKLPEARVVGKRVQVFPRHAELMKEIDEAIKKAPTIEETVTEDGKKLPGWKETVKFKVDGEHEIINTKEALEAYKNLVKRKEWAVLKQRQKGFAGYPEAVPVAGKQVEFGDYIIMKEKGWISDGEMAIKAEIPAKSKPNEAYKAAYGEKRPAVKDIMPEEKNLQDAEFAYNALRTAEQQSVSRKPIYADPREYMEIPLSIFRVGDQYAHVRQKKIQFVKKHYPDAAWKVSPEETKAVAFDKGKPVAIVMGTKSSTTDFMAKEPELHEQAREAGLIVVPKKIKKPKIYPISDPRDLGKTTQELLDIPEGGRISWEDKGWVKTDKGWVPVGEEGRKGIGSQVFAEQIQREVKVAPPTRKKPWEMTRDQYWTEYVKRRWTAEEAEKPDYILRETEKLLKPHREAIQRALSEGKPVPPEVLAEYPKLAPPVEKVAEEFFDAKGNYIKVDKAPQGNWTFYRVPAHKKGLKGTRIKVRGAKAYYPTREEAVKALQEYAKKRGFIPRKLPEEVFAEAREKIAAQKETVKKWVDKHGPVSFEAEVRGYERPVTIRVTPSAKKPGFWQATFFDEKGPFRDIVLEDYPKLLAELVGPERIDLKTAKVRRLDEVIDKYYQEGLRKEKARKERGGVRMRIPSVALPKVTIGEKVKGAAKIIKDEFDRLKFFPHTPMAFRSAVRLDIIGKLDQRRIEIYDKTQVALWGGMETSDIRKSVEIIYARDQVSRTKLHKGDPKISLEEAQKILADAE